MNAYNQAILALSKDDLERAVCNSSIEVRHGDISCENKRFSGKCWSSLKYIHIGGWKAYRTDNEDDRIPEHLNKVSGRKHIDQ